MEFAIYQIPLPSDGVSVRTLDFYAGRVNGVSEAFCLGFADHDKPRHEESELEYHERQALEAANRTMRIKSTIIDNGDGKPFDQRWECQAVLIALWRKLEGLGFLKLPPNPFLGDPPPHINVVDFTERFARLKRYEKKASLKLNEVRSKYGRGR